MVFAEKEGAGQGQPEQQKTGQAERRLVEEFKKKNTGDLSKLKPVSDYLEKNKGKQISYIWTDETGFLDQKSETHGLYSRSGFSCVIVCGVLKDFGGNVKRVGLVHVSSDLLNSDPTAFEKFFGRLGEGGGDIEITIVSGEREVALEAFKAAKRIGKIVFMNCDFKTNYLWRYDSLLIDKEGNVYYDGDKKWTPNLKYGDPKNYDFYKKWRPKAGKADAMGYDFFKMFGRVYFENDSTGSPLEIPYALIYKDEKNKGSGEFLLKTLRPVNPYPEAALLPADSPLFNKELGFVKVP